MRSLCGDVYEKADSVNQFPGLEGLGAAQISLLEGSVMLLIKIYILEVCLASIIAWDSFELDDILQDELIVGIVRDNIVKDEHNIDLISYFCNDIIRKRENMTDVEKYKSITSNKSAFKYMVEEESKYISATVKKIFKFSDPLTTDLSLNIVKNSDPDFKEEYKKVSIVTELGVSADEINEKKSIEYSSLYENTKLDYVLSA